MEWVQKFEQYKLCRCKPVSAIINCLTVYYQNQKDNFIQKLGVE